MERGRWAKALVLKKMLRETKAYKNSTLKTIHLVHSDYCGAKSFNLLFLYECTFFELHPLIEFDDRVVAI